MSEEPICVTHVQLVDRARRWLSARYPVVCTEITTQAGECADVIGWRGGVSTLIECKISRSDYYSDKNKSFRRHPENGVGNYRYFFAPKGLIVPKNLPENWGLVELWGQVCRVIKKAEFFEANYTAERIILSSIIRRIGQQKPDGVSIKAYYETTALIAPTVTVNLADEL